jgi:hypothetical protein
MCKDEQIESENNNYSYIVMGGVSKDKLKEAYDAECDASVVITTYDYLKVGVSIPRMDTMILTSPRRSGLTQIIGRISRRGGDVSKVRIVDDIYDVKTIFRGQLVDRLAAYKLRNGKIKKYNKIKYTAFEGELVNLCVKFINELSVNGLLFDNQVVEEKEVIEEKEEVIKSNNKINDIETIDKEEITPKQEVNNMLGLLKLNVKLMLMVIDELKITEVNRNNTKFDVTKLSPNLKKEVIKYAKLVVDEQGNIISNKEEKIIDVLGRDTSNLAVSYSEDNLEPNKNINTILSSTTYTANDIVTTKKKEIVKPVKKTNISIEQKIKDFKL